MVGVKLCSGVINEDGGLLENISDLTGAKADHGRPRSRYGFGISGGFQSLPKGQKQGLWLINMFFFFFLKIWYVLANRYVSLTQYDSQ